MTHLRSTLKHAFITAALASLAACVGSVESDEDEGEGSFELSAEQCQPGDAVECDQGVDPSVPGVQFCVETDSGDTGWTACEPDYVDGDSSSIASTPLVLSFDNREVRYVGGSGASFALSSNASHESDWPTAHTPWLALNRNGNGTVDDGSELFGSATRLAGGRTARQGFEALAEFDDNGDGFIRPDDAGWSQLLVWADGDASRSSSSLELSGLDASGLIAIELAFDVAPRCDARGNCEKERARFWYRGSDGSVRTGSIVDIHLAWQ